MKYAQYALLWAALACLIAMMWWPENSLKLLGTLLACVIGAIVCSTARAREANRGAG